MGRITHITTAITDRQYRVVPLRYRYPRNSVCKSQRAAVGGKRKVSRYLEAVVAEYPIRVQLLEKMLRLSQVEWLDAPFARYAMSLDEVVVHGEGL